MVQAGDYTSEKLCNVSLYEPFLGKEFLALEYCICTDDPVEYTFLVCSIEVLDCVSVEKWKRYDTDDLLCASSHELSHCERKNNRLC